MTRMTPIAFILLILGVQVLTVPQRRPAAGFIRNSASAVAQVSSTKISPAKPAPAPFIFGININPRDESDESDESRK